MQQRQLVRPRWQLLALVLAAGILTAAAGASDASQPAGSLCASPIVAQCNSVITVPLAPFVLEQSSCPGLTATHGAWMSLSIPANYTASIDMCGSSLDVQLIQGLTCGAACDYNYILSHENCNDNTTAVEFEMQTQNWTNVFALMPSNRRTTVGNITVTIRCDPVVTQPDTCAAATELSCGSMAVGSLAEANTVLSCARTDGPEANRLARPGVWYKVLVPAGRDVVVHTCSPATTIDTTLAWFDNCSSCSALGGFSDNSAACGRSSQVVIPKSATARWVYLFVASSSIRKIGNYSLTIQCPSVTCATDSVELTCGQTYSSRLTAEGGIDGLWCLGDRTVESAQFERRVPTAARWFKVNVPGGMNLVASTCGSNTSSQADTFLSVGDSCSNCSAELVYDRAEQFCSTGSRVVFQPRTRDNSTVYLQLADYRSTDLAGLPFTLRVQCSNLTLGHMCESAKEVSCDSALYDALVPLNNSAACNSGSATRGIWYKIQVPANYRLAVTTCGGDSNIQPTISAAENCSASSCLTASPGSCSVGICASPFMRNSSACSSQATVEITNSSTNRWFYVFVTGQFNLLGQTEGDVDIRFICYPPPNITTTTATTTVTLPTSNITTTTAVPTTSNSTTARANTTTTTTATAARTSTTAPRTSTPSPLSVKMNFFLTFKGFYGYFNRTLVQEVMQQLLGPLTRVTITLVKGGVGTITARRLLVKEGQVEADLLIETTPSMASNVTGKVAAIIKDNSLLETLGATQPAFYQATVEQGQAAQDDNLGVTAGIVVGVILAVMIIAIVIYNKIPHRTTQTKQRAILEMAEANPQDSFLITTEGTAEDEFVNPNLQPVETPAAGTRKRPQQQQQVSAGFTNPVFSAEPQHVPTSAHRARPTAGSEKPNLSFNFQEEKTNGELGNGSSQSVNGNAHTNA
eukprot:m.155387 g.155387  ORF g.155387 m.155387 type:complete len:921 (+) comp16962_c0_seq2:141-2903(+)